MNELTLLRELVVDEPIDDEAARAEVWRRLHGHAVKPARERRRRIAVALAATLVAAAVAASAFATVRELFFVKPFAQGKITRTVDGIRFSLSVPPSGWENGPHVRVNGTWRTLGLYVSKSFFGPQDADVVLLWTAFPKGGLATPCAGLVKPAGRSAADLATGDVNGTGDQGRGGAEGRHRRRTTGVAHDSERSQRSRLRPRILLHLGHRKWAVHSGTKRWQATTSRYGSSTCAGSGWSSKPRPRGAAA